MTAVPLALLWACAAGSRSASDEVRLYTEVLAQAGTDPEREMGICLGLADEELRGDCAQVVAVAATRGGGEAAAWCARVPEGRWRSECSFQAAELSNRARDTQSAATLCQQAGRYRADCVMHLWRPDLGRLVEGMGPEDFARLYPRAEGYFQRSAAQGIADVDLESRFWLAFFQAGFERAGQVDPAACAPLSPQGRLRCERAAALLLTAGLEAALRSRDMLPWFCAQRPPRSAEVAALIATTPSVALDQALQEQQPQLCGGGQPALNGGPRTR